MNDNLFVELSDGTKITVNKPTVKTMLDFVKIVGNSNVFETFDSDSDSNSDSDSEDTLDINTVIDTMQFIFGDVLPVVATAVNIPEDELQNMDPNDYASICKKVIEVYSSFLGNMELRVK